MFSGAELSALTPSWPRALERAEAIFASGSAFAALRADYSVVVWGATLPPTNPLPGGGGRFMGLGVCGWSWFVCWGWVFFSQQLEAMGSLPRQALWQFFRRLQEASGGFQRGCGDLFFPPGWVAEWEEVEEEWKGAEWGE